MLGGGNVEVWSKNILYWFIEGKIYIGMPDAKMSLALNQPK